MSRETELELMGEAAMRLARSSEGRAEAVAERAGRLASRLEQGRFHMPVLGEFKRGKSTLLNALVGSPVLPMGAVPVTAVAVELSYGPEGARVVFSDGRMQELGGTEEIASFVTEEANPGNAAGVDRVEVRVAAPLLETGLVLVDTPGIGSVHPHNDETAARAQLEADGAIVVLSADAPLSRREREVVSALAERQVPTFFVLNKVDHLDQGDLDNVRRFVTTALASELPSAPRLWCVAALAALRARSAGEPPGPGAWEFGSLEAELRRFVEQDLLGARLQTARRELARLAGELATAVEISSASLRMRVEALAERVEAFREAASAERAALADERVLLDRDVSALAKRVEANLLAFARNAPSRWFAELEQVALQAPVSRLEQELRGVVERAVKQDFESFREQEADFAEQAWHEMAERQRGRVEQRVNSLRAAASDLFSVRLPEVRLPEVSEERERFFYLFVHVGSSTEYLGWIARRLLPPKLVRRRLLDRARQQLLTEFDKHAGRARWDLTQRLDSVRLRFQAAMAAELDRTVESILGAASRAEQLHQQAEEERERQAAEDAEALRAASAVLSMATEASPERATS